MADSEWMDYTREWRGNQPAKGSMHQTVRARAGISFLVHVVLKRALLAIGTPRTHFERTEGEPRLLALPP